LQQGRYLKHALRDGGLVGSRGLFLLRDIRDALDHCLPGCRWILGDHNYTIQPPKGAPPYRPFPSGAHGKGWRAEIEVGHVKRMARQFGILDCMKQTLEGL